MCDGWRACAPGRASGYKFQTKDDLRAAALALLFSSPHGDDDHDRRRPHPPRILVIETHSLKSSSHSSLPTELTGTRMLGVSDILILMRSVATLRESYFLASHLLDGQ